MKKTMGRQASGNTLAILAQSLYLLNLLLLPGLALIGLLVLWWKNRNNHDSLGRCHLHQSLILSGLLVVLLGGGGLLIWLITGTDPSAISMLLLYLIVIHTGFVLIGMIALAKAMSHQHFHITGRSCPSDAG